MQTFIASFLVLISAVYLLRMWLPVVGAKKGVQLSGEKGSQRAACTACNACGGCG
ncbi:MAG: hypothetical protein KA186_08975 [Flavobacteriales bacterium]|nr:hypothetical protein [Flavobacteriales bacterium]